MAKTKTENRLPAANDANGELRELIEPLARLDKDLRAAARTLGPAEARYLVDTYYSVQEYRKATENQVRAMSEEGEPHQLLTWLAHNVRTWENDIKRALDEFTDEYMVGRWMKSLCGIGPVISAGMLAQIDIRKAPTAGHIWRFAGLDPTRLWLGREKAKLAVSAALPDHTKGRLTLAEVQKVSEDLNWRWETVVEHIETHTPTADELCKFFARCPWNARLKVLCVHPDCHVTTIRGPVPIRDVVIGDQVLTHLGRWRRVTKVFENQHDGPLYGLRAANSGNAVAWLTAGHPVYGAAVQTWRTGRTIKANEKTRAEFDWHAVETIEPRWKLARPVIDGPSTETLSLIEMSGVHGDDGNTRAEGKNPGVPHHKATPVASRILLDTSTMRLIGLYLAEGHTYGGKIFWSFHEQETDLVSFVQEQLMKLTGSQGWIAHNPANHTVQVGIGCKPLADKFTELLGSGSGSVKFPHGWLSDLGTAQLRSLWDGIMDGDGDHVGKDAGKRISTANPIFARQLVDLGRRCGLSVSLHTEANSRAFRVYVNDRQDREPQARETLSIPYTGMVYNLEVEEDHSYCVEGYAVHNCWKLGDCFVKFSGHDDDFYGAIYHTRKEYEAKKNEALDYKDQAEKSLREKNFGKETEARKHYEAGKLPPARLHLRAMRYAVKLFLSHLHQVMHQDFYDRPAPAPFPIEKLAGHTHFVPIPNWPFSGGGRSLKELLK